MAKFWRVVGGAGKGGILVREGAAISSPAFLKRLDTGSVVRELTMSAGHLQYELVQGDGPNTGWVSEKLAGMDLIVRATARGCSGTQVNSLQRPASSKSRAPLNLQLSAAWRGQTPAQSGPCGCLKQLPTASPASDQPPPLPDAAQLSDCVWRILGRNPSPYSLTGTNMYLVGTGARRILIDAGEGKSGVLQNLLTVMKDQGCTGLDQIVITHWHHDHLMGVPELLRHFGSVPIRKYMPQEGTAVDALDQNGGAEFDPNEFLKDTKVTITGLTDNEMLSCEGATLRVLFTPGHANDHVSLLLENENALFTGDNILGWGTGVFQDLPLYMASLRKVRDLSPTILYPAHGPVVGAGKAAAWIQMYISHREQRIEQVAEALRSAGPGGSTLEMVARSVYGDQPHVLQSEGLFRGAKNNCVHVLEYLQREGQCRREQGRYMVQASSRL